MVLVSLAFLGLILSGCASMFNEPPIAVLKAFPTSGLAPLKVNFDGSNSTDPNNNIKSYEWDFGDGAGAMGKVTSHTYQKPGTYTACLTVTDNFNKSDSDCTDITVENNPPIADFDVNPDPGDPLTIHFNASDSRDKDGTIDKYEWDFGDNESGRGRTISHHYSRGGTYTVILTVTDNLGAEDTESRRITVQEPNKAPRARISISSQRGLTITFDGSSSYDPDGTIVSYQWNFGDGVSGLGVSVSHTYAAPGSYVVSLVVTDNDGARDSDQRRINVIPNTAPNACFTGQRNSPLNYTFNASCSQDPDGFIVAYNWIIWHPAWPRRTFTGRIIRVNFPYPARVCVRLTVTDNQGATDSRQGCGQVTSEFESWRLEEVNPDAEPPDFSKEE